MTDAKGGYVEAFYELAAMMGIGARAQPPKVVWEREMKPRLKAALEQSDTVMGEAGDAALIVERLRSVQDDEAARRRFDKGLSGYDYVPGEPGYEAQEATRTVHDDDAELRVKVERLLDLTGLAPLTTEERDECNRDAKDIIDALNRSRLSPSTEEGVLRSALDLARNRLRAAAINEAPKQSREYYEYSQWADEADAALAGKSGEGVG